MFKFFNVILNYVFQDLGITVIPVTVIGANHTKDVFMQTLALALKFEYKTLLYVNISTIGYQNCCMHALAV